MNRNLCFALLISAGCMLWGCSSEIQNPVSSDTPVKGELKALYKVIPEPKNVTAVVNRFTVTITWDSVATASRYHVVILKGTSKYLDDTMQVSRQIVLTNMPAGGYSVTIAGIVVSATGPSAEGTASVPVLFNTIPYPKNVTAVVSGSTVTISWDTVAIASRYHVVILKGTSKYLDDTMQVSQQIVLTNVPGGGYSVTIARIVVPATGLSAEGTASAHVLFTVSSVVAPSVTVMASPVPLCPRNGKWVTVTFSGVVTNTEGGASYELKDEYRKIHYIGTVAAGQYSVKLKLKDRRAGYDRDGRQYTFKITATNSAGTATASVIVTVPREKKQRGGHDKDDDDDKDDDWGGH